MFRLSVNQLVAIARSESSFYKKLYSDLPENWSFQDLPVVPYDDFANHLKADKVGAIFTEKPKSGFVASSSSTTGSPKMCTFSKKEWLAFATILGRKVYESGTLEDGDVIANLTMPGRMRTSYLAASYSQFLSPADCVDIPICGTEEPEYIAEACQTLNPNVLAGLSFTLLNLAHYLFENNIKLDIKKIFYGGELMYGAQEAFLREVFPDARIVSYMYGSNESGIVGYSDRTCEFNEHRVCSDSCIVEIVDEKTHESITANNVPGLMTITNLTKTVLPVIRYPTGDRAMWLDEDERERKFTLLGRISEPTTNIGELGITQASLRDTVNQLKNDIPVIFFQLHVNRTEHGDKCVMRTCLSPTSSLDEMNAKSGLRKAIMSHVEGLKDLVDSNQISFDIELVGPDQIIPTTRSAKHKQILDNRS